MSSKMSSEHLWVYGTLRYGCTNAHADLLRRGSQYLGVAHVQARLYRIDWYPGILLGGSGDDRVVGDLFELRDSAALTELDQYEGSDEYRRTEAEAVLASGERVKCWVYEYILPVNESQRIVSGDWLKENGAE